MLDGQVINGGFFVLEPGTFDYIAGDATVWEEEPLRGLVAEGQLSVYRHPGYWQNMDTLRDKHVLQATWEQGRAPWAVWLMDRADAAPVPPAAMPAAAGREAAKLV